MNVVILCGGKGTRMREESEFKPKPLVEIGGRPVLWHIMKLYDHYGFRDFVLCLGYKGNMIKEYFLDYDALNNDFAINLGRMRKIETLGTHEEQDYRVVLADTGQESLTGARVKRIEQYITEDTFMVTYGDGVSNVNIEKLLAFHKSHGKIATITTARLPTRYGILDVDKSGKVASFAEKPQLEGWANVGFFVFDRKIFKYLDDAEACALEDEPLKSLARDGQLMAFQHDGFFYAMDTYREYLHLNDLWDRGEAPWAVWSNNSRPPHAR